MKRTWTLRSRAWRLSHSIVGDSLNATINQARNALKGGRSHFRAASTAWASARPARRDCPMM